jgi:hypothetical protein
MRLSEATKQIVATRVCDIVMFFLAPVIWVRAAIIAALKPRKPFIPGEHLKRWIGRSYRIHYVRGVSIIVEVVGVTRSWPVPSVNRALVIEFPSGDLAVLTSHQWKPLVIEEATPAGRRIVASLEPIDVPEESMRYDLGAEGILVMPKEALIWADPRKSCADVN